MAYIEINGGVRMICFEVRPRADSDGAMGRPPLGMKPTTIRLPLAMLERIKRLVGSRRVALFIREAVEGELRRREAQVDEGDENAGA